MNGKHGYLKNCLLEPRNSKEIMFVEMFGCVIAQLDGYAIVPVDKYEALQSKAERLQATLRDARCAEVQRLERGIKYIRDQHSPGTTAHKVACDLLAGYGFKEQSE